eukprot:6119168-Karenia_brevis.AAC.1
MIQLAAAKDDATFTVFVGHLKAAFHKLQAKNPTHTSDVFSFNAARGIGGALFDADLQNSKNFNSQGQHEVPRHLKDFNSQ